MKLKAKWATCPECGGEGVRDLTPPFSGKGPVIVFCPFCMGDGIFCTEVLCEPGNKVRDPQGSKT